MAVLIGYDLNKEGKNYAENNKKLIELIKKTFPTWWHYLDSTWIVVTTMTCVQIRDLLITVLDKDDELLVARLSGEAAWFGFDDNGSKWLKEHL